MKNKPLRAISILLVLLLCALPCAGSAQRAIHVYDHSIANTVSCVLYYLNPLEKKLVPRVQRIRLLPQEDLYSALIHELKTPPDSSLQSPYPKDSDFYLISFAQSAGVATINIGGSPDSVGAEDLFIFQVALVNTITELSAIKYVNILFNGSVYVRQGYEIPMGTMTYFNDDLSALWYNYQNENRPSGITKDVTLYFLSADKTALLPEVQRITFTSGDYSTPLIQALIQGPKSTSLRPVLPKALSLMDEISYKFLDGTTTRTLEIPMSAALQEFFDEDPGMRAFALSAIVATLTGFVPGLGLGGITVSSANEVIVLGESAVIGRNTVEALIGKQITLFFPTEDGRLVAEKRVISNHQGSLRDYLLELARGPQNPDAGTVPPLPEGFSSSHIKGITQVDNTVLINLTQSGYELMRQIPQEQERSMVYSIINTLTELTGVYQVQFLCEDMTIDSFSGWLDLRKPLIRNPGLIVQPTS